MFYASIKGWGRGRWVGVTLQVTADGGCCGWLLHEYGHAVNDFKQVATYISNDPLLSELANLAA